MWQIIGWVVWAILAFYAVVFAFGCRTYVKSGKAFQWATGVQTVFLWVITTLFLIFGWNKLHILWITPIAFFAAPFFVLAGIPVLSPIVLFVTKIFLHFILIGAKETDIDNVARQ